MILQSRVGNFKPGFLSSPWSKMDNLSVHSVENYLNFSKLTQLLSVGQFLRPLGAFKTEKPNRRIYFSGLVNEESYEEVEELSNKTKDDEDAF